MHTQITASRASTINLQPEQPHIIAAALPELVGRYVEEAHLRAGRQTGANYDYLLSLLLEWWSEAAQTFNHVLNPAVWRQYERWLRQRRSSQSGEVLTINSRQRALNVAKQLLTWAFQTGHLDRDFSDQIPTAKGEKSKRPALTIADLSALMRAAGQSRKPIRDQTIIAVFVGTGIRRAELAGLDIEDIEWYADGGGQMYIRQAKLQKPRWVVFDAICGAHLAALCDELGRSSGPLICGWKNNRLGAKAVYSTVKDAMRRAGIDSRGAGPHDLRRAFATAWLRIKRSLGDGQLLSMQMGHSGEAMSVLYSRPTLEDLHAGFASPLALLDNEQAF